MTREKEREKECLWLKARADHKAVRGTSVHEGADRVRAILYEADSVCIPGHGR